MGTVLTYGYHQSILDWPEKLVLHSTDLSFLTSKTNKGRNKKPVLFLPPFVGSCLPLPSQRGTYSPAGSMTCRYRLLLQEDIAMLISFISVPR